MAAIADERLRYAAIEAGNGTGLISILSPGMLFALAVCCVPDGEVRHRPGQGHHY